MIFIYNYFKQFLQIKLCLYLTCNLIYIYLQIILKIKYGNVEVVYNTQIKSKIIVRIALALKQLFQNLNETNKFKKGSQILMLTKANNGNVRVLLNSSESYLFSNYIKCLLMVVIYILLLQTDVKRKYFFLIISCHLNLFGATDEQFPIISFSAHNIVRQLQWERQLCFLYFLCTGRRILKVTCHTILARGDILIQNRERTITFRSFPVITSSGQSPSEILISTHWTSICFAYRTGFRCYQANKLQDVRICD